MKNDYIEYCEECQKAIKTDKQKIYTVYLNGLGFDLCESCTENVRHNADFIERW